MVCEQMHTVVLLGNQSYHVAARATLKVPLQVPVITLSIPISSDGDYKDLPQVAKVYNEVMFPGGINAPKRIIVEDNFGRVCVITLVTVCSSLHIARSVFCELS